MMKNLSQLKIDSPIGCLYLVASDDGLQGVYFKKQPVPFSKTKILSLTQNQLEEYFDGKRKKFDLPLDLNGTPFQQKVWSALTQIPYGKTCSYRDIARKIKNEKAVRAVGTANGKNPICVIIPCHRVIASDGSLGGYSGGLKIKSKLLELELI